MTREYIQERVADIIVDKLSVEPYEVTLQASFTNDLGADSLDAVELIMEFEKEFGLDIPDDIAEQIHTVGDIVDLLVANLDVEDGGSNEPNPEVTAFQAQLQYYFDNMSQIVNNNTSVRNFLRKCENTLQHTQPIIQASYRFLQAICCLRYCELNDDPTILSNGRSFIQKARDIEKEDKEYQLYALIYERKDINPKDKNAYNAHLRISQSFSRLDLSDLTLWTSCEYLIETYNNITFETLTDAIIEYENVGDFEKSCSCNELLTELDDKFLKFSGYSQLARLYAEKKLTPESKGFEYAKLACEYDELQGHPDAPTYHWWTSSFDILGLCYYFGRGTSVDYNLAFQNIKKAADLGCVNAFNNLACLYEYGHGTPQNIPLAIEWYKKAYQNGMQQCKDDYERLESGDSTNTSSSDEYTNSASNNSNGGSRRRTRNNDELIW